MVFDGGCVHLTEGAKFTLVPMVNIINFDFYLIFHNLWSQHGIYVIHSLNHGKSVNLTPFVIYARSSSRIIGPKCTRGRVYGNALCYGVKFE